MATVGGLMIAASAVCAQQIDQDELDQYLVEIERLISVNDLEGARDKLAQAASANLRDESLEIIHSQLRLLESLNASSRPAFDNSKLNGALTDQDMLAAVDLLDSLRIAMENGELEQVKQFSEATPQTVSLLNAVFQNYAAMKVKVSSPEADNDTQSFLATLEFKELTTLDGNTAFPAQAWKTHRLRIIKSDGAWQKVLW